MREAAIILTPEAEEVSTQALTISEKAKSIVIINQEDYIAAGEFWKTIKALRDKVSATFDPIIKKAHEAHKEAIARKAEIDKPLEGAQKIVKGIMESYDREQERIRKAEEERLRREAEKKAEEERLAAAIEAEKAGNKEEAEAILEEKPYVAPVILPKVTPKMEGGPIYRTVWKFRVVNQALIPREYMKPDEIKIGGVVRSLKDQTKIPGIEVYSERV